MTVATFKCLSILTVKYCQLNTLKVIRSIFRACLSQATEMTTEVRQQIDAELKKAGISEVRSEMVVASAEQREMRISSVQKTETAVPGKIIRKLVKNIGGGGKGKIGEIYLQICENLKSWS